MDEGAARKAMERRGRHHRTWQERANKGPPRSQKASQHKHHQRQTHLHELLKVTQSNQKQHSLPKRHTRRNAQHNQARQLPNDHKQFQPSHKHRKRHTKRPIHALNQQTQRQRNRRHTTTRTTNQRPQRRTRHAIPLHHHTNHTKETRSKQYK